MQTLAIQLALNGAAVLLVSLLAGLLLYRAILFNGREAAWHLVHAGGSARGIMLMALAATIHLPALPDWQLASIAGLIIFFAWTSMLAMLIAAATGERGLRCSGSFANRLVYLLYGVGTVAVFPAFLWLIAGLLRAL
jgi:hypothetical protein